MCGRARARVCVLLLSLLLLLCVCVCEVGVYASWQRACGWTVAKMSRTFRGVFDERGVCCYMKKPLPQHEAPIKPPLQVPPFSGKACQEKGALGGLSISSAPGME